MPVVFSVDDDYGIQSARLLYKVASAGSEPTQDVALPLWEAPGGTGPGGAVKHQEVRYEWDLAPMNLAPGSIITFHAEARDFDNLKGPNLGKSREIRLRIISDEDILRRTRRPPPRDPRGDRTDPRDAEAGHYSRRRRAADDRQDRAVTDTVTATSSRTPG